MTHDKTAFPLHDMGHGSPFDRGMTLRDYFAAKALLAGWAANMTPAYDNETRAKYAYELADAMMKERQK
jgi:hypothetical protein